MEYIRTLFEEKKVKESPPTTIQQAVPTFYLKAPTTTKEMRAIELGIDLQGGVFLFVVVV